MKFSKWYVAFSWVPIVSFGIATIYVKSFDGWGAWAAARVLILPVLLSAVFGAVGIFVIICASRGGRVPARLILSTLLSGCISLWFLGKVLFF